MKPAAGFTLVEVLVALVIMAVALLALLNSMNAASDTTRALQLRMLAGWEADNQLALLRQRGSVPMLGEQQGSAQQGGYRLGWHSTTRETEQPGLLQVRIEVHWLDQSEARLAERSGYFSAWSAP